MSFLKKTSEIVVTYNVHVIGNCVLHFTVNFDIECHYL